MANRGTSLKRTVRSLGGKAIRRLGLLPGGQPDGLGDDEKLANATLHGDGIVYFADTTDSLYQLEGWYGPLAKLHEQMGLTIICQDSRTARAIRHKTSIPVHTVARDATLDALISRSNTKLVFYVNYNPLNTQALRSRSVIHVNLLHGDSDKAVSVSNQVKAYDFSFVAGEAAIERYEKYSALFDARSRCIPVGRPALDTGDRPGFEKRADGGRLRVLYAPTWEGGQASVAYSSLIALGHDLLTQLFDAGIDVTYRPHPLTGVRLAHYGEADAALRDLVTERGGRISKDGPIREDFARADLLICDVSAVASDWLVTQRPLIITSPTDTSAREAGTELLQTVPRLGPSDLQSAAEKVREHGEADPEREQRIALTERYLGDITPGASLDRFLTACTRLSELRDREWGRIHANENAGHEERSSRE